MNKILDEKLLAYGLTFDDVLLIPLKSEVLPNEVSLRTKLTKKITLNIPLLSSAMDTVTEYELAIAIAESGGAGVIHKNLSIDEQARQVKKVKKTRVKSENACIDSDGSLIVGAAVGVGEDTNKRVEALVKNGVDFIVVDSAHGHSKNVIDTVKYIRERYSNIDIIAGNIVTKEAAKDLVEAGVDCVKVGVGPGSICTTRVVAGVGVPQITAISDVYSYCAQNNICIIADGGIKYSGDIVKALAIGADVVMMGSIFASTEEAPGDVITIEGKRYKTYVGMGSLSAMKRGSSDRYFQKNAKKFVPEGIESLVMIKGSVSDICFQLIGGIKAGMGYAGASSIYDLKEKSKFVRITSAGLRESHPHDVIISKDAPNYYK